MEKEQELNGYILQDCEKSSGKIKNRIQNENVTDVVQAGYASEELVNLLENCVAAHCNIVIGGRAQAGKMELLKYLSFFIPDGEKIGVYKENPGINHNKINPDRECVDFVTNGRLLYSDFIELAMKLNVCWLLLPELRGPETWHLLCSLSTGLRCITTIDSDEVQALPDRMCTMSDLNNVAENFTNNIYRLIDIGVLVEYDAEEKPQITQAVFYNHDDGENGENTCTVLYDRKKEKQQPLPEALKQRFLQYGIEK